MAESTCPSCGKALESAPKRRTKCLHCGQPILVRGSHLFTESGARAVDVCAKIGVPFEQLCAAREALSKEFGRNASLGDAAWRILNQLVVSAADFHDKKMIYFQMARFLWEDGRDHLDPARQCARMQLAEWQNAAKQGLLNLRTARVTIITAREDSCPACRALEGKEFAFADVLKENPIPMAGCTHEAGPGHSHGWCRCEYGLVP